LRDQQRRGILVATTTLTVADYMAYWLEHIAEPSIRGTTYATYEGDVRLHIIPGIGRRKLKSLQAARIRAWLNELRTTCQCCPRGATPPGRARGAVRAERSVLPVHTVRELDSPRSLRAARRTAGRRRRGDAQPERGSLVQLRVTDDRKVRSFTRDEALRFLQAAEQHRLYALWALGIVEKPCDSVLVGDICLECRAVSASRVDGCDHLVGTSPVPP
jgi:integrase